ncbi:MAG: hypothetical protein A3K65_02985, partial [Euryarchaeota archaeon RBG_16_68_12]
MPGPPKGSAADPATVAWIRERFRRYYKQIELELPPRFTRREFGFMLWEAGMMQRHKSFKSGESLRNFLVQRTPMHTYYSSAYYENPGAPTMEEKGWLGADLVFDLDADHIPGSEKMGYEEMLEAVKKRIIQLYDDFLVQDFGFEEGSLRVVFSGGRGYHIHVSDERVWALGSHERREIVDYITGKDFDFGAVFRQSVFDVKEYGGRKYDKRRVVMVDPLKAAGWQRKVVEGLQQLAKTLEPPVGIDSAVDFLSSFEGIERSDARRLWDNLFEPVAWKNRKPIRGVDRLLETGQIEVLNDKNVRTLISVVRQLQQIRLDEHKGVSLDGVVRRGETDEPVTSDIKRLIRMPHSLHGKTGLAVVPMSRKALESFLPLRDAVPAAWTDEPTRVRLKAGIKITMRDENFNLK